MLHFFNIGQTTWSRVVWPGFDANGFPIGSPAVEPPKKKRKVTLGSLLGGRVKKEVAPEPTASELDELEQYLADTEVPTAVRG